MYQHPEIFSSESITPVGAGARSTGSSRRRSTRRTTSSTGSILNPLVLARRGQPDRPGRRTTSAGASSPSSRRRAACDFVTDFALRLPDRGLPDASSACPISDADLLRARGSRTSSPASAATSTSRRRWATALGGIRQYWVDVLEERRGEAAAARGRPRLAPACTPTVDDAAADRRRDPRHADRARPRRARHDAGGSSATCSGTSPSTPTTAAG